MLKSMSDYDNYCNVLLLCFTKMFHELKMGPSWKLTIEGNSNPAVSLITGML